MSSRPRAAGTVAADPVPPRAAHPARHCALVRPPCSLPPSPNYQVKQNNHQLVNNTEQASLAGTHDLRDPETIASNTLWAPVESLLL